jgi:hypothetical protein
VLPDSSHLWSQNIGPFSFAILSCLPTIFFCL